MNTNYGRRHDDWPRGAHGTTKLVVGDRRKTYAGRTMFAKRKSEQSFVKMLIIAAALITATPIKATNDTKSIAMNVSSGSAQRQNFGSFTF